MGQRVSVTDSVRVMAPPEQVWASLLDELTGARTWWAGTNEFVSARDPSQAGAETAWTVRPNGPGAPGPVFRFTSTTVCAEPQRCLELAFRGVFSGTGRFVLAEEDAGICRLDFVFDVEVQGWPSLMARVVDMAAGHSSGTRRAFDGLARHLERDGGPQTPGQVTEDSGWLMCGTTMAERRQHRVTTDYGDSLLVDEWLQLDGRPPAATAILIHGWGASSAAFGQVTEELLRKGMRVITPDLPGHGRSVLHPAGQLTLERLAAAIGTLLDHFGDSRTVLAAHSGAGLAAVLAVAGTDRVHGLVLLSTALRDAGASPPELVIQGSRLLNTLLRGRSTSEALLSRTMGPSLPPPSRPLTAARLRAVVPAVRRSYFEASAHADLTGFGRRVTVPTVVLAGHEDQVVPSTAVRTSALAFPHGTFRLLPGRGHALPEEAPEEVAAAVAGLLG